MSQQPEAPSPPQQRKALPVSNSATAPTTTIAATAATAAATIAATAATAATAIIAAAVIVIITCVPSWVVEARETQLLLQQGLPV